MSEETVSALAPQIVEAPPFDPENQDHVWRWELAGRPPLDVVDSDGNLWRPTITKVLQPDGSYVATPAPRPPDVSDIERVAAQSTAAFIEARRAATLFLDNLKGKVHAALIFSGAYDNAAATAQGVAFVQRHSVRLNAFKDSGGHPDAASLLLSDIVASVADFSWLTEDILAIFSAALTPK